MKKLLILSLVSLALFSGGSEPSQAEPCTNWVELHPDEDWNNFEEDEVQLFQGILEYEEDPQEITFTMRFNPYKLRLVKDGEEAGPDSPRLDVYGRSPKLEAFVGKRVQIKGKREQTEISGVLFDEIWPTAVAEAP